MTGRETRLGRRPDNGSRPVGGSEYKVETMRIGAQGGGKEAEMKCATPVFRACEWMGCDPCSWLALTIVSRVCGMD